MRKSNIEQIDALLFESEVRRGILSVIHSLWLDRQYTKEHAIKELFDLIRELDI